MDVINTVGILERDNEIDDGAQEDGYKPIPDTSNIPGARIEPAPPWHVAALAVAKVGDPSVLRLGMLAGEKPCAAQSAADAPHAKRHPHDTLQPNGCNGVIERGEICGHAPHQYKPTLSLNSISVPAVIVSPETFLKLITISYGTVRLLSMIESTNEPRNDPESEGMTANALVF